MSAAALVLSAGVWRFVLAQLLLSAALWASYRGLGRLLRTATDRFLFLRLSLLALWVLPALTWLPERLAPLPPSLAAPLVVTARLPLGFAAAAEAAGAASLWTRTAAVLAALYLLWVGRCVVGMGRAAYRMKRLVRGAQARVLPGGQTVLLHDGELPPATVGWLRPQVLIAQKVYADLELRALQLILRHEAVHMRRYDPVLCAFMELIRALVPFNPFVRMLARHFDSEMELSVDEAVLADPTVGRREYGQLLLDLSTRILPAAAPSGGGVYIARSLVARRISAMAKTSSGKSRPILTLAAFGLISLAGGLGISALPGPRLTWAETAGAGVKAAADSQLQFFLVEPAGGRSIVDDDGSTLPLAAAPILTAADLDQATFTDGENPTLSVHLRAAAAARFAAFSGSHLGHKMAIVLAGKLLAAPVIKARIDGPNLLLSGHFPKEMQRLAAAINAGSAAAAR